MVVYFYYIKKPPAMPAANKSFNDIKEFSKWFLHYYSRIFEAPKVLKRKGEFSLLL